MILKRLDPNKLSVEFRDGITKTAPIEARRYTLTHSDITAELFLTIGLQFAYDNIGPMRDEVLAEWQLINNSYILYACVYVDGQLGLANPNLSAIRNSIFVRELSLALEAIRYGDDVFFKTHSELNNAPIYVYFTSMYPYLNRIEYWGTPSDYE